MPYFYDFNHQKINNAIIEWSFPK